MNQGMERSNKKDMKINLIESIKGVIFGLIVSLIITPFIVHGSSLIYDTNTINQIFNKFTNENLNYINDYFNNNYKNGDYLLFVSLINEKDVYLSLFDKKSMQVGTFENRMEDEYYAFISSSAIKNYKFNLNNNSLSEESNPRTSAIGFYLNYDAYGFPIWSSKDFYWKDIISNQYLENFKYLDINALEERYKKYYSIEYLNMTTDYIYTLIDLVGINKSKPPSFLQEVTYTIKYYFDNALDSTKTEIKTGEVGQVITEFTNYASDKYELIENQYELVLTTEDNVLNIYYQSKKKIKYKIEYYFDDILKENYTEIKEGLLNEVITEFTNYASDYWSLVENEYTLTIQENSDLNIMRIYYRSPNYGTKYQIIDTKNSKIPFIFHFTDIKEMFPSVNFNVFNQYEQLSITIFVNLWFIGMFSFITWLFLKMIYKVFQLFS